MGIAPVESRIVAVRSRAPPSLSPYG